METKDPVIAYNQGLSAGLRLKALLHAVNCEFRGELMLGKLHAVDLPGRRMPLLITIFCALAFSGLSMPVNLHADGDLSLSDHEKSAELYIEGLEALADEKQPLAKTKFTELQERFPGSPYLPKAEEYLFDITTRKSNDGIVPFYLGNLATATYSAMTLPYILGYEFDPILGGLTGLAGVASGLGSAYLMSRDYPVSAHQSWWIESIQLISLGNYIYAFNSISPFDFLEYDTADRLFQAGIISTALTSRSIAYALNRESSPSRGKAAFMLQSYGWATAYYWLFAAGVLESDHTRGNNIGALLVSDAAAAGSLPLWENLRWSSLRTGLVTVGGLGGALLGFFSSMMLSEIVDLSMPETSGILIASALAGQGAAVYLTDGMEDERGFTSPQVRSSRPQGISVMPAVSADRSFGLQVSCSW